MIKRKILNKIQLIQTKCIKYLESCPVKSKNTSILSIAQLIKLEHAKIGYRLHHGWLPSKIKLLLSTDSKNKGLEKEASFEYKK